MTVQELKPPKLDYGWLQNMVLQRDRYRFVLPAGKRLITTPKINVADADFFDLGVTHINYNDGIDVSSVPVARRAVMAGKNYVANVGKPIVDFTDDDLKKAIDGAMLCDVFTSQVGEHTNLEDGSPNPANIYCYDYTTPKTKQLRQGIAAKIRAGGGIMCDEYDGQDYLDALHAGGGIDQFMPACQSNEAAYNYLHTTPMGFHSHAYWLDREFEWRDGIIQTYWNTGPSDGRKWIMNKLLAFHLDRMAKKHVNTTSKTIAFGFPMGSDFVGYGSTYRRDVPGGGYVQGAHQPAVAPGLVMVSTFLGLNHGDGYFGWQTTERFGQDPALIPPDGNGVLYVGGGNPQRLTANNGQIATQTGAAPYPTNPQGYNDLPLAAGYMYAKGAAHAGSTDWAYAAVKQNGAYPTLNQNTYPIDQFKAGRGNCVVIGTGGNRAVYYWNAGLPANVSREQVTVKVEEQELSFTAPRDMLVCQLIKL